jgi:uncharacterized protein
MTEAAQLYFRRVVFKTYRYFKHPRRLKNSPMRQWFARHFLDKVVWKPTQHTLAGGLAIGMGVMMQLMPGQMPVAALLAAIFRVNIPIAVIACWISNPFTFVPFGWAQMRVGEWFMPRLPSFVGRALHGFVNFLIDVFHALPMTVQNWIGDDMVKKGAEIMSNVYLGGLIIGIGLTIISYPLSWIVWEYFTRLNAWRRKRKLVAGGEV